MPTMLTIGQLSEATGVPASTIRFWERRGLLPLAQRRGGQRRYTEAALTQVATLLLCQEAGFTLAEVCQIEDELATRTDTWRDFIRAKITDIERDQARLAHARTLLEHALECHHEVLGECPDFQAVVASRLPGRTPAVIEDLRAAAAARQR
ncbi:MerR family transcriptional regulator [Labedaea rhizosphaerae]|nr:MerR family transcriptional regulator [Labedaea rhizosphaerae]